MKNPHTTKNHFFFVLLLFKVQFHGCLILKLDRLVEMKARCESKFSWTCFTYTKIFMYTVVCIYFKKSKPPCLYDDEINFTFNFIHFPILTPMGDPTIEFDA